MSGKPRQDVVSGIHAYLTHMGNQIKAGKYVPPPPPT